MLQVGEIIDQKYRIVRELGSGSMGAVYEGVNIRIKRNVAIKVLLPGVATRSDTVQRFEREAQAAGRIGSAHIVEVLDLGSLPDGSLFMVMEFLDGMTLGDRIRTRGRLAPNEIAILMQQLLTGLEMAHEARIIHRDLKPDNIFLMTEHAGQQDFVKILDFGVSKFNPLTAEEGMSMTRTGTVMGTPFYMSPEQAKGARSTDERSDLYAVGVILYEAVTGQVPYNAGTFNELIFKIVLETPAAPETFVPNLDPGFGQLIRKSMARDPEQRFQTAAAFRDAISVWLHTGRGQKKALGPPPSSQDWAEEDAATVMFNRAAEGGALQDFALAPAPGHAAAPAPMPHLEEPSIEIPGVAAKRRKLRWGFGLLVAGLLLAVGFAVLGNSNRGGSKKSTATEAAEQEPSATADVSDNREAGEEGKNHDAPPDENPETETKQEQPESDNQAAKSQSAGSQEAKPATPSAVRRSDSSPRAPAKKPSSPSPKRNRTRPKPTTKSKAKTGRSISTEL